MTGKPVMKEYRIGFNEAGQRFDKYLGKLLPKAPPGFCYKMLRKKNITLNGHKAAGNERLTEGDTVCLFLAEETIESFQEAVVLPVKKVRKEAFPVLYEDTHILLLNKPVGLLSQPDRSGQRAAGDLLFSYLMEKGEATESSLRTFRPSFCNRLDRNTSGILIAGKTLAGLQSLSQALKERTIRKYYLCLAAGEVEASFTGKGSLKKNMAENRSGVILEDGSGSKPEADGTLVETRFRLLENISITGRKAALLEAELVTGKSHQIRASLLAAGHPLIGDPKYGDPAENRFYREQFGIRHQMLHAYRVCFDRMPGSLAYLDGKEYTALPPAAFQNLIITEGI